MILKTRSIYFCEAGRTHCLSCHIAPVQQCTFIFVCIFLPATMSLPKIYLVLFCLPTNSIILLILPRHKTELCECELRKEVLKGAAKSTFTFCRYLGALLTDFLTSFHFRRRYQVKIKTLNSLHSHYPTQPKTNLQPFPYFHFCRKEVNMCTFAFLRYYLLY